MPHDLDRDAVIYLTHRQWEGKRELDSLQLTTQGKLSYEQGEDVWRVSYKESDVTGLNDTLTSVSLYPDGRVRISREGQIRQELDFIARAADRTARDAVWPHEVLHFYTRSRRKAQ